MCTNVLAIAMNQRDYPFRITADGAKLCRTLIVVMEAFAYAIQIWLLGDRCSMSFVVNAEKWFGVADHVLWQRIGHVVRVGVVKILQLKPAEYC